MKTEKVPLIHKIINAAVIILGLCFLLLRARYGWCWDDEPFLVSLAQRLWYGQSLITDEWHVAQLAGVLILPFYGLFRLFSDGNTGVLLALRYAYCALWFAVCLGMYFVLNRKNRGAILAYAYLVLFSPLDYMTLSYTSFGLMSLLLTGCLYYRHFEIKPFKPVPLGVLSSLLWCVLVLCCPYMAIGYVLLFSGTFLNATVKKRRGEAFDKAFLRARLIDLAMTALCAGLVVYFFILRGNSIDDIAYGFKRIFEDPQHLQTDIPERFLNAAHVSGMLLRISFPTAVLLICFAPILKKHRTLKLSAFALAALAYAADACNYFFAWRVNALNSQGVAIVLLGLVAYVYLSEKPRELFRAFAPLSLLYGVCSVLASNTSWKALYSCLTVAGAVGLLFIAALGRELCRELREEKAFPVRVLPALITLCVMLTQLTCSLGTRLTRQYEDYELSALTDTVELGAAKGLVVRCETKEEYEKKYLALRCLLDAAGTDETDGFMTPDYYPVLYLDAELPPATFSSWSFGWFDKLDERFLQYYDRFPDKKPTVVFCSEEANIGLVNELLENYETYTEGNAVLFHKK